MQGYFPILITHQGSVPYFRVRLVDDDGAKSQKFYGLFDTITRVIGIVDTWENDAVPQPPRVPVPNPTGECPIVDWGGG